MKSNYNTNLASKGLCQPRGEEEERWPQKMNQMIAITGLFWLLVCGQDVRAHEDTPLKVENGGITGLPDQYLPASFDFKETSVTIAGKKLIFPAVLSKLFTHDVSDDPFDESPPKIEVRPYKFEFSASWYHGVIGSDLPPYMLITVTPVESEDDLFGLTSRFELLIDLDKLKFIRADVQLMGVGRIPIDLDGVIDSPSKPKER